MFWIDVSWNELGPCRSSLDLCFISAVRLSAWAIYKVQLNLFGRRIIGGFSSLRRRAKCTRRPNLKARGPYAHVLSRRLRRVGVTFLPSRWRSSKQHRTQWQKRPMTRNRKFLGLTRHASDVRYYAHYGVEKLALLSSEFWRKCYSGGLRYFASRGEANHNNCSAISQCYTRTFFAHCKIRTTLSCK